jgi:hypothetical protein
VLRPSLTVVCRIDTLEKPFLSCRCIGYAVLKLFADASSNSGGHPIQPVHDFLPVSTQYSSPNRLSGQANSGIYLNAGEFLLPIVYGKIPTEGKFCESLVDTLPHIPDAYLIVRLYDPASPILESENHRILSRGVTPASHPSPTQFLPAFDQGQPRNIVSPVQPPQPQRSQVAVRRGGNNNNNNNNNNQNGPVYCFEMNSVLVILCQAYQFITQRHEAIISRNRQQLKLTNDKSSQRPIPPLLQAIIIAFHRYPLHDSLVHDILSSFSYAYENEKKLILKKFTDWVQNLFPNTSSKIPMVDSRYFFYYHSKIGINLALEMLYNMPIRQEIVRTAVSDLEENGPLIFQSIQKSLVLYNNTATPTSSSARSGAGNGGGGAGKKKIPPPLPSGRGRGGGGGGLFSFFSSSSFSTSASSSAYLPSSMNTLYDNHIKYYKTYFRYLPGNKHPAGGGGSGDHSDAIIDDASLELDLHSREYFPIFNDEFSRTNGIDLSPYACVLVVVVAVDCLTNSVLGFADPTRPSAGVASTASSNNRKENSNNNSSPKKQSAEENSRKEKKFKLKGLLGVYFGSEIEDEESVVYWGILPLLTESPFDNNHYSAAHHPHHQEPPPREQNNNPTSPFGNPFSPNVRRSVAAVVPFNDGNSNNFNNNNNNNDMVMDYYDDEEEERLRLAAEQGFSPHYNNFMMDSSQQQQQQQQFSPQHRQPPQYNNNNSNINGYNNNNNANNNNQFYQQRPEQFSPPDNYNNNNFVNNNNNNNSNNRLADEFFNRNYGAGGGNNNNNSNISNSSNQPNNSLPLNNNNNADSNNNNNTTDPINSQSDKIGFYFVNTGQHQVPLFAGVPPSELLESGNPMAWVLSHIADEAKQEFQANQKRNEINGNNGNGGMFSRWFHSLGGGAGNGEAEKLPEFLTKNKPGDNNNNKKSNKKNKNKKGNCFQLTPGSSAIVNIVDPRLKKFGANSISYELVHLHTEAAVKAASGATTSGEGSSSSFGDPLSALENNNNNGDEGENNNELGQLPQIQVSDDYLKKILRAKTMNFHQNVKHFIENKKEKAKLEFLFRFNVFNIVTGGKLPASFLSHGGAGGGLSGFLGGGSSSSSSTVVVPSSNNPTAVLAANYWLTAKNLKRANQIVRSYQDAIPPSIHPKTLIEEINEKFVSVIGDSLNTGSNSNLGGGGSNSSGKDMTSFSSSNSPQKTLPSPTKKRPPQLQSQQPDSRYY